MSLAVNEEKPLKHLFDGSEWNVYDENVLNLGVGAPGPDLLSNCCEIFQKATAHRMRHERENQSFLFQYGPTSGMFDVRLAIAQYFTKKYDDEVKCEDLVLTTGATQGLHIILSTLIDLNGFVFLDEVTYMIAISAIKQFNSLQIVPVKLNADGIDLDQFEIHLKEKRFTSETKPFWALYYAIPTYHNPTGILFSEKVCQGLIRLAREYDFLISCDDVYNLLNYSDSRAPKRLYAFDESSAATYQGNVISNGSFSKIVAPGVRLGWMEVPARIKPYLENSGILRSGGCLNNYTSGIVASLFELNLVQEHIDTLYAAYKERMIEVISVLKNKLPPECSFWEPEGGYFVWIRMPQYSNAQDFLHNCLATEKIFFISGDRFSVDDSFRNCFRISIAFHSKSALVDGCTRLCSALGKYIKESANRSA